MFMISVTVSIVGLILLACCNGLARRWRNAINTTKRIIIIESMIHIIGIFGALDVVLGIIMAIPPNHFYVWEYTVTYILLGVFLVCIFCAKNPYN